MRPDYAGLTNPGCTNPLFAAQLLAPPANVDLSVAAPRRPSWCNLPPGNRTASFPCTIHTLVACRIGSCCTGGPDQPGKPAEGQAHRLADWTLILGNDPLNYDYAGIDPHMVESYQGRGRARRCQPAGFPVAATSAAEGADPISGREWITNSTMPMHQGLFVDRRVRLHLQARNHGPPITTTTRYTTKPRDPTLLDSCDCSPPQSRRGSLTTRSTRSATTRRPPRQDFAKAYIRRSASCCSRSSSA